MIKFGSVCSGIEAASVAWHPLGWEAAWLSEIEKFPSQVLAHHYPNTPNFGDMTKFKEWSSDSAINVLVGGTPCQSFSVAGLRKGLDDPRGNLMLTYLAIAAKYRPKWLVWENVPGVLSSNGGLDFASLLRGMGELGYGFAYRVLDAQYFGVAQRRRRVFVVGYLGNWRPAAAVLFERHSLCGYPAPSREKRQVTPTLSSSGTGVSRVGFNCEDEWFVETPIALAENTIGRKPENGGNGDGFTEDGPMYTLNATGVHGVAQPVGIFQDSEFGVAKYDSAGTLRAGRIPEHQMVMHPLPFDTTQITSPQNGNNPKAGDPCHPLAAGAHPPAICLMDQGGSVMTIENDMTGTLRRETHGHEPVVMAFPWQSALDPIGNPTDLSGTLVKNQTMAVAQPIGLDEEQNAMIDAFGTLKARTAGGGFEGSVMQPNMQVRRLTPVECERLQGFPDGYTDIQSKGKATPDGPRYKALGNSMAVPVMAWIGKRIQQVEDILG